jgi:hypothetical protein
MLATTAAAQGSGTPGAQSLPVLGTQSGSLFADRTDTGLSWYLPALAVADPTTAFAFTASIGPEVDSQGRPFDTASLAVPLTASDPPDVVAAKQASPARRFQQIPPAAYDALLVVPFVGNQGEAQTTTVSGQIAPQADGSLLASFDGLVGATVVQAYVALMSTAGATLQIGVSYQVWKHVVRPIWRLPIGPLPVAPNLAGPGDARAEVRPAAAPQLLEDRLAQPDPAPNAVLSPVAEPLPPRPTLVPDPRPELPYDIWLVTTARTQLTVALGSTYASQRYREQYTIAAPPPAQPRVIVDVSDLTNFETTRSEFEELTSLGDVRSKYPSFTSAYLGQVTGTVVAIPAAYGIVHGSGGCSGSIDILADPSPTTASGSRFQFTFELAPIVDPVDFAQLSADLAKIPEAQGRTLLPTLPTRLDSAVTPTFSAGSAVQSLSVATGPDPNTIEISFEITDSGTGASVVPAWAAASQLVGELVASTVPPPLFGTVGLRLDDAYPIPPTASFFLALTHTASADDLAVTASGTPPVLTASNQSPNDLRLVRMLDTTVLGNVVVTLGSALRAGTSAALPSVAGEPTTGALVYRNLDLTTFSLGDLPKYVSIHAETVEQIQHLLTVNATAVNFAAEGIAQLDILISLDALPATQVPTITLTDQHQIDSVTVVVPVGAVVVGLASTLAISVQGTSPSGDRHAEVSNDFLTNPIFDLLPADLAAPP